MKDIVEHRDSEASKSHLELDQLGRVLKAISNRLRGTTRAQHHTLIVDTYSLTVQVLCVSRGHLMLVCSRLDSLICWSPPQVVSDTV